MKIPKQTMGIAALVIIFSLGFWIIDSLINFIFSAEHLHFILFDSPDNFADSLLLNLSNYTIFIRISFILVCIAGGLLVNRYVNKLKKTESDLYLREASINATITGIMIADSEGIIQWCNPAILTMTGYTKNEIIGQYIGILKSDAHDEAFHKTLWQTIQSGQVWQGEIITRRKDGRTYYEEQTITPIFDENNQITNYITTKKDITKRKNAQDELKQSEERYRMVVASTNEAVILQENTGKILTWNPAAEQLFGISAKEIIGKVASEIKWNTYDENGNLVHGSEHPSMHTLETGEACRNVLMKITRNDGSSSWVDINTNPVFSSDLTKPNAVVITLQDVTERKIAEAYLRNRERELSTLMDNLPGMAYRCTNEPEWTMQFISQGCLKLTGYHPEELVYNANVSYGNLISPEDKQYVWNTVQKAIKEDRAFVVEYRITDKTGVERWVWERGIVVDASGDFEILEGFISDITERKHLEHTLRDSEKQLRIEQQSLASRVAERTAELQKALKAKDEFLATMSHELRTPLTAILGMSEILETELRGPLNETQKKYVSSINKSGQHLLTLINDILDMAKIEAGRLDLNIETIHINQICESSLMFIAESAKQKSLNVKFENANSQLTMEADPRRLKQILINLLGNSVKFTPKNGTIGLNISEDKENNSVIFTVWDNGIGISLEDQKKLFQPFMQVESSLDRRFEGTGLGLSLVARLTQLHGGSVSLTSQPDQGTKVLVTLPKRKPFDQIVVLPETGPLGRNSISNNWINKKILIVEDNPLTVETLLAYLEAREFNILVANDGASAVSIVQQEKPDTILMDIQMPNMNGLEAIQHIRALPQFTSTPIIAISALAMPGDKDKCMEAGADHYLSKPIRFKDLEKLLHLIFKSPKH